MPRTDDSRLDHVVFSQVLDDDTYFRLAETQPLVQLHQRHRLFPQERNDFVAFQGYFL